MIRLAEGQRKQSFEADKKRNSEKEKQKNGNVKGEKREKTITKKKNGAPCGVP